MSRPLVAAAALALAGCMNAQPCPSPLEECGGRCVDLASDAAHCGGCGQACAPGRACRARTCTDAGTGACAGRSGGAFVVLDTGDGVVKLWTTSQPFIDRATALLPEPYPYGPGASIPVLDVLAGTDCDAQWTWHVDPEVLRFDTAFPNGECNVPARRIETEVHRWLEPWCPQSRVLAVDPR